MLAGAGVAIATPETLASAPELEAELLAICERPGSTIAKQHCIQYDPDDDAFDAVSTEPRPS